MAAVLAAPVLPPPGKAIRGSHHDFNSGSYVDQWGNSYTAPSLCAACHAAHKVKRNYPLWGRQDPTLTGWIVWNADSEGSSMVGQALDPNNEITDPSLVDPASNPTGLKYLSAKELVATGTGLCMSCHDGQTAIGMADDGLDDVTINPYFRGTWGRNLADMHPVGRYVPFGNPGWQASIDAGNAYAASTVVADKGTVGYELPLHAYQRQPTTLFAPVNPPGLPRQ